MPGWHEATKTLQAEGKIRMAGIVEEQHGDRARLFMQWKAMDWPVMVDALNLLRVPYVPITLCIDEHGIVRKVAPPFSSADAIVEEFLAATYERPAGVSVPGAEVAVPPDPNEYRPAVEDRSAESWSRYAAIEMMWGGEGGLDRAIGAYRRAVELDSGDGWAAFGLGVSHRARYDSRNRRSGDFGEAVAIWQRALDLDPNNYIHRRRIQQYGPREQKPYPFYDWIKTAREEIEARGDTPVTLRVEPAGAEFAAPQSMFDPVAGGYPPDPDGRITADRRFVLVESVVVPSIVEPGRSVRVHLELRPELGLDVHWNNEVDDVAIWIEPPEGWVASRRNLSVPGLRDRAVSQETRHAEFEIKSPENSNGTVEIPAYALYYVCEGAKGACLYRRQDFRIAVRLKTPAKSTD